MNRLAMRSRPERKPVLHQTWARLLFLHWPIPEELLRPLIPGRLAIDTYDGTAWVGVTPFTLWGTRPSYLPPIPLLSDSHEINVRTYVHLDGVPGVWFLSLDASNPLAVWGARMSYHLPYYHAKMDLKESGRRISFSSRRTQSGAAPATIEVSWERGTDLPRLNDPDSLDFFLIERYCLYTEYEEKLYRARIFHSPWPLCRVENLELSSTMLESHGLPTPEAAPLLHHQTEPLKVNFWYLDKV